MNKDISVFKLSQKAMPSINKLQQVSSSTSERKKEVGNDSCARSKDETILGRYEIVVQVFLVTSMNWNPIPPVMKRARGRPHWISTFLDLIRFYTDSHAEFFPPSGLPYSTEQMQTDSDIALGARYH